MPDRRDRCGALALRALQQDVIIDAKRPRWW